MLINCVLLDECSSVKYSINQSSEENYAVWCYSVFTICRVVIPVFVCLFLVVLFFTEFKKEKKIVHNPFVLLAC